MWTIELLEDPIKLVAGASLRHTFDEASLGALIQSTIVFARVPLQSILVPAPTSDEKHWKAFQEGGRAAKVALADFYARNWSSSVLQEKRDGWVFALEPLDWITASTQQRRRRKRNGTIVPYILERTDFYCQDENFHVYLRLLTYNNLSTAATTNEESFKDSQLAVLQTLLTRFFLDQSLLNNLMNHVATSVLQERLRNNLRESNLVAFVANGSILPRQSGASTAPMASPPAVPFEAPADSCMCRRMLVDMGLLRQFLQAKLELSANDDAIAIDVSNEPSNTKKNLVSITGLVIPRGITLIVGGGYHGKSTMLRCIAAGVYNKCFGDGRELCVTVEDAVTVRAEDGRYVNNCNISAFISNLPTPPGVVSALDTSHFSTGEASGSTSQAANVVEAIEMGASSLLVDEDVSAANFMARDGRMRAMVMDESITPLLYRVNGLYDSIGISSIVVVGGVGDWLDVPHNVILMDRYLCKDATAKARSVSRQFSHGHVQYAGRGVVHRLEWDKAGSPYPRRPSDESSKRLNRDRMFVALMEGMDAICVQPLDESALCHDDSFDENYIDMSRCEQLLGKKPQLYGTGLGGLCLLEASQRHPDQGMAGLLSHTEDNFDRDGFVSSLCAGNGKSNVRVHESAHWKMLVELVGCAFRPRRFEVGQALTRLRGVAFDNLPEVEDDAVVAAREEAERKKRELLEMWSKRRAKK